MSKESNPIIDPDDFVLSLREVLVGPAPNPEKLLRVAAQVQENPAPNRRPVLNIVNRSEIPITDGDGFWFWQADSLRGLFRGDRQPPVLGDYPEAYQDSFVLFDIHALELSDIFGDRTDTEMLDIYTALRRRPDGRSLGPFHDYMWQAAALVLGTSPRSQAEYEAIVARLERSCRTFQTGMVSRNYIGALRQTLGRKG